MKNTEDFRLEELSINDIVEVNGGSFGYDVGWAIHWFFAGAFNNMNPNALAGASIAYANNNK